MWTETLLELVDRLLAKHAQFATVSDGSIKCIDHFIQSNDLTVLLRSDQESSPSLTVMAHYGAPPTLDEWLGLNNVNIDDPYDAELYETLPEQFHDEYRERFSKFVPYTGDKTQ